jgi:hypothetical protein
VEQQQSNLFTLGIFPKCPFYKPVPVLIILVLIAFGTLGIYFLNFWAAVTYLIFSIFYYFVAMPFTLCKYCYYRVTETTSAENNGEAVAKLVPLVTWREVYLRKHVGQKNWTLFMTTVWFLPTVLIVISFFFNFSPFALTALIGFIAVLVGNWFYMLRKKCPTCAIREECHSSF